MAVKTIQAVDNALVLLEQLARDQPVGVSALAREVGEHTAERLSAALEELVHEDLERSQRPPGGPARESATGS